MDEFYRIDTPENVTFGYEIAGLGSRFLAAVTDYFIIALFSVSGWIATAGVFSLSRMLSGSLRNWLTALLGLLIFAIQWGYFVLFDLWWNGQSPGKRLFRLRVVRTDGTAIRPVDSIIRNLVRIIDYLPANYFVGFVTMFLTSRVQRLGDLAAGTMVVKERRDVTLDSLLESLPPPHPQ